MKTVGHLTIEEMEPHPQFGPRWRVTDTVKDWSWVTYGTEAEVVKAAKKQVKIVKGRKGKTWTFGGGRRKIE